jgi:hypothetical protein
MFIRWKSVIFDQNIKNFLSEAIADYSHFIALPKWPNITKGGLHDVYKMKVRNIWSKY